MKALTYIRKTAGVIANHARRFVVATVSLQLLLLQLAGAFAVLYGIAWYNIPAALIVGGCAVIFAVQSHPDTKDSS